MENPRATSNRILSDAVRMRRSHGRATLGDVATSAGVTPMTVSRALREPHKVSPQTLERVRQALASTGYSPNKQAGMLASGRSRMVAAIIPNISHSVFAETVQGLSDVLQTHGFELLLASSGYSLDREEEQIRAVLGWSPAALVVTGRRHSTSATQLLQEAQKNGVPVVQIWDLDTADHRFSQIGFSHKQVGEMMAEHLVAQGKRELVYVDSSVPEDFRAHERGQAFRSRARDLGARAEIHQAEPGEPMQAGRTALRDLIQQGRPQAMAFANDHLAAGAYWQANDDGLRVPQDLLLLGFGDFPVAQQLGGGMSTIRIDRYEIGSECAKLLLASAERPAGAVKPIVKQHETRPVLLARRSTGA